VSADLGYERDNQSEYALSTGNYNGHVYSRFSLWKEVWLDIDE
jgi:hypothetical protein